MAISKQLYANNAKTTLASAVTPTDTVIYVSDGSRFPDPQNGQFFLVTLESGSTMEVIKVTARSGNTFTNCERAVEDYPAGNFPSGARVENRATKETYETFAKLTDRLDEITSVDDLDPPQLSNGNSYICRSNDSSGNPVIAIKDTNTKWRFVTHRVIHASGTVDSGNTTSIVSANIPAATLIAPFTGKYIIQFTSGLNTGYCRNLSNGGTGSATWTTPLPNVVSSGDQFEIYKSDAAIISELVASADDGLVYSIVLGE